MEFCEKLKILRTQANLTQDELANSLMISRQAISNYEQGRGYPSIDILVGMSKFFNISLDELLSTGIRKNHLKYIIASVSLLFICNIINLIAAYFLRQDENRLIVNIVFMIGVRVIPFLCFFVYMIFQCKPPKKINKIYGYRTKSSMTNQLTWDYAQVYFSLIFAKIALVLFSINIIYSSITPFLSPNIVLIMACILLGIQALSLICPVYFVEKKLKIFLGKNK